MNEQMGAFVQREVVVYKKVRGHAETSETG